MEGGEIVKKSCMRDHVGEIIKGTSWKRNTGEETSEEKSWKGNIDLALPEFRDS